ncbi:MAG: hypothetical protein QXE05_04470, partial [Nitrososphaeria archaeon]
HVLRKAIEDCIKREEIKRLKEKIEEVKPILEKIPEEDIVKSIREDEIQDEIRVRFFIYIHGNKR